MRREIEGELFHEIEEYGGKKYEHIGFRDKENKFGDIMASIVPRVGMRRKAKLIIEVEEEEQEGKTKGEEWIKEIEELRREKDEFFRYGDGSPIPMEEREGFEGLSYFPVDRKFRFVLDLKEHPDKENIEIEDTSGQVRRLLRWGEFGFELDGKEYRLQAYTTDPRREEVFVPFKDKTNGKETYEAGRYIDLYFDRDRIGDKWVLDFNKAYNPWCAYSMSYACPFVPPENWLDMEIRAGEKKYVKASPIE